MLQDVVKSLFAHQAIMLLRQPWNVSVGGGARREPGGGESTLPWNVSVGGGGRREPGGESAPFLAHGLSKTLVPPQLSFPRLKHKCPSPLVTNPAT